MTPEKFVFLLGKLSGCDSISSGLKFWSVKANGLLGTANRTLESDQQLSWAHAYKRRMRRFNLMVVSVAFVAITWLSVALWHLLGW
jgi:hypothetical protein